MDFGYVLKRAWEIIWKFKVLWIFGILASCSQAGGGGGGNSGYRFSSQDQNVYPQVQQFFNQNQWLITFLIVIGIIVAIILVVLAILLGTVGRVGLIRGTVKAEQGASKLTFGELWREGLVYFWRVFGLNLLLGLIILFAILALVFLGVVLSIGTLGIALVCLIPLICLLVPVMWLVSIVIEQANVALVVENLNITEAIKRGWQVFIDNIGSMIVMGLILTIGIGLIGGLIIGLPLIAVAAPAAVAVTTGVTSNIRNGIILSVVLFIIYLPFLLFFNGVLKSYIQSAWTLTFMRLVAKRTTVTPVAPPAPVIDVTPPAPSV